MNDKELEKLVASKVINKASAEKLRQIKDLDQRLKEFDSLFEIGEADIENYLTYNNVTKDMLNLDSIEAENLGLNQGPAIQDNTRAVPNIKEKRLTPLEVAQASSKKFGTDLETEMQTTAGFPRVSREFLKDNDFPIWNFMGDLSSAAGRASVASFSDKPFLEAMAEIDPDPYNADGTLKHWSRRLLESTIASADLPISAFTGAGALNLVSKIKPLMKSIESGSRLAKAGRAGLAGAGATLADMTFEQSTRPEGFPMMTLGDYGLGLGLGAGLGALGGGITKPKPKPGIEGELSTSQPLINEADNPYTISQITNGEAAADAQVPISSLDRQKNLNKELKKIKEDASIVDGKKISKKRLDAVEPILRQDYFKKFNPEFDIPAEEYVKVATAKMNPKLDSDAPRAISPLEFAVQKQATPAYEAYKKNMNKLGEQIGKTRKEILPSIEPIKKDEFVEIINNALDDDAIDMKYVDIDGEQVLRPVYKDDPSSKIVAWDQNTKAIANLINDFSGDMIDGRDLRFFQSRLNKLIPEDPKSRQRIDTPETRGFINISKASRNTIDEGIENFAGEDVAKNFRETRAKYARMKETAKDIGSQLGKSVYFRNKGGTDVLNDINTPLAEQLQDYEKAYTKGENAIKRILQSQRAQGAKNNWDEVRSETGYDVAKAAAYALQAGLDAGDHTASSLLSNQKETIQAIKNIPTNREGFKSKAWDYVKKPIAAGVSKGKQAISPDENLAIRALGDVQEAITPQEYLVPDFSYIQDLYRVPEKGMRQDEEL